MPFQNTSQAAHEINVSPRTLERWRYEGKGPRFYKFGSRCLYSPDDLKIWVNQQVRTSTSNEQKY